MRLLRPASLLLAALAFARPAGGQGRTEIPPLVVQRIVAPQPPAPAPADTAGLRISLTALPTRLPPRQAPAPAVMLPAGDAARIFSRLQPITAAAADSFAFPARTLPPPRTGRTVLAGFPPPDSLRPPPRPASAAPAPLAVVRAAPQGEVPVAAEVTVTFSQAMVPLSSVAAVEERAVPVRISPAVAGTWRWLDVRTAVFTPAGPMPFATEYTATIPAGTRSVSGAALAQAASWTFRTPAPTGTGGWPYGGNVDRTPLILLRFDQRIGPAALLPHLRATAAGRLIPLRLATAAEVEADSTGRALRQTAPAGTWVALRARAPLPYDAEVRVEVAAGAPSAEGPLRTESPQGWSFRTYGPLRLTDATCGGARNDCRPGTPFVLTFSTPLDTAGSGGWIRVTPAIPGMQVRVQPWGIVVVGATAPETRYEVTVARDVRDVFGQRLGAEETRALSVRRGPGALLGVGEVMRVVNADGPRRVPVLARDVDGFRLEMFRVRPEDWTAYRRPGTEPPGERVVDRWIDTRGAPGLVVETRVDLDEVLRGEPGHVVVRATTEGGSKAATWFQVTRVGISATVDTRDAAVWATSLRDGSPVARAEVRLLGDSATAQGRTDAQGLATIPLPAGDARQIVVAAGTDRAFLPHGWDRWKRQTPGPRAIWYGITDRGLYRPGEEVHFKGWVRLFTAGPRGGVAAPGGAGRTVEWIAHDERDNEIARGTARLTAQDGFDGSFAVPAGANLGGAGIALRLPGFESAQDADEPGGEDWRDDWSAGDIRFEVEEFRRPEYEVSVTADPGPYIVGGAAEVTARAAYFSGGGLPGAAVSWTVSQAPAYYAPPGWEGWRFGGEGGGWRGSAPSPSLTHTLSGETDLEGRHAVRIDFGRAEPPVTHRVTALALIQDVNRQTWTEAATLLVHPARIYVGLRTERAWQTPGQPLDVEVVAADLDGAAVPGVAVRVRAERLEWTDASGAWREVARDSVLCDVTTEANPRRCALGTPAAGRWRIVAEAKDAEGRPTRTETSVWVWGGGPAEIRGPRTASATDVTLLPDRETYAPGDTARILVQLPFWPARGVMTVLRGGIVSTRAVEAAGSTLSLDVPITAADIPQTYVQLELVGASDTVPNARGTDFATGLVRLSVPPGPRGLTVTPVPADSVALPDAPASVSVQVRDAEGRPVRDAEVALVAVDESVLALAGYRLRNPLDAFYPPHPDDTEDSRLRSSVLQLDSAGSGVVTGRVTYADGKPAERATVSVNGTALSTVTDAAGAFRLAGVPLGLAQVRAVAIGYGPATVEVRVGPQAALVEIVLTPQALLLEDVVVTGFEGERVQLQGRVAGVRVDAGRVALRAPAPAPPPPGGADSLPGPAISVRSNFDALALWAPVVRTDADGRARVPFTLPSSLTRYRIMAVAVQRNLRYGTGEAALTVRQRLSVRPSPPRFLNFGDRFELPVVVENQTDAPLAVDVVARGEGIEVEGAGLRVTVPAHDRAEVRLPARAVRAGTAALQVAAVSGSLADAAVVTLPVYTPATAEAFATYGSFTDGAADLPLEVPADALPGFGGLEVTTSSTALNELSDAFLYLISYPYDCAEQIASRLIALAALRDVLAEMNAAGLPSAEAMADSVARDVEALQGMQGPDGGFDFWGWRQSWPYVSLHATHALLRIKARGYTVPEEMLAQALRYVRTIDQNLPADRYGPESRAALRAYALYVRELAGDEGVEEALRRAMGTVRADTLGLETAGWLLSASAGHDALAPQRAELLRMIGNRATETASTATFVTRYEEGELLLLHSQRRTDAIVLEALLKADPESPLVTKTVRGLLGQRTRGRWDNTQENAWVLLALDRYFRAYEAQTPDFVARLWLGDRFAGEQAFRGRSADRQQLEVPMAALRALDPDRVTLSKDGPGRLYYRAGLRYAPRALDLDPLARGFTVERTYEAVDSAGDVTRGADGAWRVRAGARVRVTVTMVAPARRVHVALVDPLPAGFEAVNTALRGAERVSEERPAPWTLDGGSWRGWWWGPWYRHQNLRDDRVEAFAPLVHAGVYTYTYVARATTPGAFVVPPPRAEEMYSPETFGRGGTDRVIVADAN